MSDDEVIIAEVSRVRRVLVYADVARVCAQNATDRARHPELSDFEYVADWVRTDPYDFLDEVVDGGDGFRVEEEVDDVEVSGFREPS